MASKKRSPTTGTHRTGKPEGASETVDRTLDLVLGRARFDVALDRIGERGGLQAYDTPLTARGVWCPRASRFEDIAGRFTGSVRA